MLKNTLVKFKSAAHGGVSGFFANTVKKIHYVPLLLLVTLALGGLPAARDYLHELTLVQGHGQQIKTPVIMYTTRWCRYCHKAREYFKRHAINYIEHDIEASAENLERYRDLNGRGVPLILVGSKRLRGFSPQSFEELLK